MKWKTAQDPKTSKPVDGAVISQCGAYHLCAVLLDGQKHYMAWHHREIIASGYDKKAVLETVKDYAAKQEKPVSTPTPPVDADWFTTGEPNAQIE